MFDPVLLRSFLEVSETLSFTRAAERLGLQQSTVSQHVRRLEQTTGRRLFARDTHSVAPTPDGEAMAGFARAILDAHERAREHFAGAQLRGRVRLGVSEDIVLARLPGILAAFRRAHPLVDVELTVELSGILIHTLDAGALDLVLGKRPRGAAYGQLVRRDPVVWTGPAGVRPEARGAVPLILYPPPSITRALAIDAVQRAGRQWRVTCTSGSLNGLRAAALGGLGFVPFARSVIPPDLVEVDAVGVLPELGTIDFVLVRGPGAVQGPAAALASAILRAESA